MNIYIANIEEDKQLAIGFLSGMHNLTGLALKYLGNKAGAKNFYLKAIEIDPTNNDAKLNLKYLNANSPNFSNN